jgi:hypothetical protein
MERRVYLAALDQLRFVGTHLNAVQVPRQILQAITSPETPRRTQ